MDRNCSPGAGRPAKAASYQERRTQGHMGLASAPGTVRLRQPRGCSRYLAEGIHSRAEELGSERGVQQEQRGQAAVDASPTLKLANVTGQSQQNTYFLAAVPCQHLQACHHQQEARLDSKFLPFFLEGFQEGNPSESGAARWKVTDYVPGTVIGAMRALSTESRREGLWVG